MFFFFSFFACYNSQQQLIESISSVSLKYQLNTLAINSVVCQIKTCSRPKSDWIVPITCHTKFSVYLINLGVLVEFHNVNGNRIHERVISFQRMCLLLYELILINFTRGGYNIHWFVAGLIKRIILFENLYNINHFQLISTVST